MAETRAVLAARVSGAVKRYPGVLALDDVDFELAPGEVRALLGKNGAGKSTLVRALTGAAGLDKGAIEIGGVRLHGPANRRTREAAALGVRTVYQELSLVPGMTITENMFLGDWPRRGGILDHATMARETEAALERFDFVLDPRRIVASLSPAERQMVEIARAMRGDPKLVILDEPTSSLAAHEVALVFRAVRAASKAGVAVIYVSHRMKEIREIADSATVMRDGKVIGTVPVAEAETAKIIRMMLGRDDHADQTVRKRRGGEVVLAVRGVACQPKLQDISFDLLSGEVLGIAGLLGAGRTELARIIAGLDRPDGGSVSLEGRVLGSTGYRERLRRGIALAPESRKDDGIFPLLGIDENIVLADTKPVATAGIVSWRAVHEKTMEIIRRMAIKTPDTATPVEMLSGGNQQKVVIGRLVYSGSRILLLDEPTRGVDVEAKVQIYAIIRTLAAEGRAIVFISSEIEELPLVCDRVIVLGSGRVTAEFSAPDIRVDPMMAACLAEE